SRRVLGPLAQAATNILIACPGPTKLVVPFSSVTVYRIRDTAEDSWKWGTCCWIYRKTQWKPGASIGAGCNLATLSQQNRTAENHARWTLLQQRHVVHFKWSSLGVTDHTLT